MSLNERAANRERAWREYAFSASFLADFVLTELVGLDTVEYSLRDLFSRPALEALFSHARRSINAYRHGISLSSIGSVGLVDRPTDEGQKLETLLKAWERMGWISVTNEAGEVANISLVE